MRCPACNQPLRDMGMPPLIALLCQNPRCPSEVTGMARGKDEREAYANLKLAVDKERAES